MAAKILGISDEVTTCECCGRTNLKRTVVLSNGDGEVFFGTECAARAMGSNKMAVESGLRQLQFDSLRDHQRKINQEMEEYKQWLLTTYGDTRSNLERRRAYRSTATVTA